VLLPDGSMVTVGGGYGSDTSTPTSPRLWGAEERHKQTELWDPSSGRWRPGPPQAEHRVYHSTAILLPDGSVVSAGDEYNGQKDRDTYEIYRPSYFFKGERPVLRSASPAAGYGQALVAISPDEDVSHAVLVAPGAATHAVT
jgi:hypothetical protein